MKVKIFARKSTDEVEELVNEFLETITEVIDIKFSTSDEWSEVLIIYKA